MGRRDGRPEWAAGMGGRSGARLVGHRGPALGAEMPGVLRLVVVRAARSGGCAVIRAQRADESTSPDMTRTRLLLDVITPRRSHRYGTAHRCQTGELLLPRRRGPHPVVVTIHGGSWAAFYSKIVMRPIAADLARRGWAVWNIEYRRVGRGQGGGWPATFLDVAAAIDHLRELDAPLDLAHVTVLGHSAGGQLALWAAGRGALPDGAPGADPLVEPVAAISQAGVNDLAQTYRESGGGAVGWLMGGSPDTYPDRYAIGDPIERVPLAIPVLLVHCSDDRTVSVRRSRNYALAAREAGGSVELVELEGGEQAHRAHVNPDSEAWKCTASWLAQRRREWDLETARREPEGVPVPQARRG